jgi:PAS domain S-box-containing protein
MDAHAEDTLELQAILDTMADGVLFIDAAHRIRRWNPAMEQLTGYTAAEVVGESCSLLRQDDRCGRGMGLVEESLSEAGRISKEEIIIRRKDGARVPLLVSARAVAGPDGAPLGAVVTFSDLSEVRRLELENRRLRDEARYHGGYEDLAGESAPMREVFRLMDLAAGSDETVLIIGETGTGKELVARAIHRRSGRGNGPLVTVNCSALSESLLESELFGHVKGAFTGAIRDYAGRFELAEGGTLFLDEVGELTPLVQVKLLRVLQERTIERVGEAHTRPVDVRVIAATHRDLRARVAEGAFRQDLFYRLNVFPIHVPPLRDRMSDVEPLLSHFIANYRKKTGKTINSFSGAAMRVLMDHIWPGNVRELENVVAHAFITSNGGTVTLDDLPRDIREGVRPMPAIPPASTGAPGLPAKTVPAAQWTRRELEQVLLETGWNKAEAARRLGVDRTTVWRRMKALGLPLQMQ